MSRISCETTSYDDVERRALLFRLVDTLPAAQRDVIVMRFVLGLSPQATRVEIDRRGLAVDIEVDGGINAETGRRCVAAGATVLAAASSIFKATDPAAAARDLARAARGET